jgi:hypothetical protein
MLDQWLGLDAATPAGGSDAKAQDNPGAEHEQGKAATASKELGLPTLLPSDR